MSWSDAVYKSTLVFCTACTLFTVTNRSPLSRFCTAPYARDLQVLLLDTFYKHVRT